MQRRSMLCAATLLPLVLEFPRALLGASKGSATTRVNRRARPSDSSWPSKARWAKLQEEVGGRLAVPQSLFGSCATEPNSSSCMDARKNMSNPFWIGDQPAGTQVSGWLNAWTPTLSAYAIQARNAADVVAGVNFA